MNLFGWVLLGAVAAVAVVDARVALRQRQAAPALGPSVAVVLLAAFAWLAHAEATGAGRLLLLALLLTLVGEPLLRRAQEAGRQTVSALAATFLARLLVVGASLALPGNGRGPTGPTVLGLLLALAVGGAALWRLRARAGDPAARGVVTAYGVVALAGVALVVWHGCCSPQSGSTRWRWPTSCWGGRGSRVAACPSSCSSPGCWSVTSARPSSWSGSCVPT